MLRTYYRYDPDQCGFVPVIYSLKEARKKFIQFFGWSLFTAVSLFSGMLIYFPEVIDNHLVRENAEQRANWKVVNDELESLAKELADLEKQDDQHFRVALSLEKLSPEIRTAGFGGHKEYELGEAEQVEEIKNSYSLVASLKSRARLQEESFRELSKSVEETEVMLASRPAIQPIDNRQLTRFHPLFGMRLHPVFGDWRSHNGLDLTANSGTPVYATGDGIVTVAKYRGGYGNVIFINHGYGFETRYAHLSKFKIAEGKKVKRGELIGLVGNTGTSTGSHLHYEILYKEKWINPIHFMYRDLRQSHFNEIIREAKK
ncbi:MAG: M23 family metallopeptidase [Cyclobacteriaceae bacterium]